MKIQKLVQVNFKKPPEIKIKPDIITAIAKKKMNYVPI